MKAIKLRTKIEAAMAIIFVIILAVAGVASVTRMISDSSDNSYTFIRNSNGNYWEATGPNIQAAIDDVGTYGTVWVGSDVTLSSELRLDGNHGVIVDFENNVVTLGSDISFIYLTGVRDASVKNVKIVITNGHTESVIKLYTPSSAGWDDRIRYNNFENILIRNPSPYYVEHNYTGIHLEVHGGTPSSITDISLNTFKDIQMWGVKTGIHLECDTSAGYGNGNHFENIYMERFETMVLFDQGSSPRPYGFNENVFQNVKGQTISWSIDGFKDIGHDGNHFDHCLVWDWYAATNGNHDWSILSNAYRTYICAHYIDDLLDESSDTTIV